LLVLGAGTAWLLAGGGVFALALAAAGVVLILVGGSRLARSWRDLLVLIQAVTQAGDATLLPQRIAVPAHSPLAPLATALTQMGDSVRGLVSQLQMQADQVRDIAGRMAQTAGIHEHNAAAQAGAIQRVAATMAELDRIVAAVTETAHIVAQAATDVLAASAASEQIVTDASASLADTRHRVGETLAAIEQLRAQAAQIGEINSLIATIAEQTRILSLNAAIEASDAGVQGRRFSVVAGEVGTLAANTRHRGQEVSDLLSELEGAVATTFTAAQAGIKQTDRTAGMTIALTATTAQMAASAARTQQLAATIDQAMAQQRESTAGIIQALGDINQATGNIRHQAVVLNDQAGTLIGVARHLSESAMRFGVVHKNGRALRLLIAGRETVSARSRAWQALVEEWNSLHPDAAIATEFIAPSPEYFTDLERDMAAGTAPDLVQVVNGTSLARQGYLLPLDDLLTPEVRADFYGPLLDIGRVGEQLYSLPTESQPMVLLYNRALFAELGIAVPRTWAEWIAAAQRCRTPDRWGLVLTTDPGEFRIKIWQPFVWQGGGEVVDSAGQLCLATPPAQAAAELWRDLLVRYAVAPRKPPFPAYDIANLRDGHCAMQYIGSWGLTMLQEKNPDFPVGVMDLPLPPGGRPANILLRWALAANARSPRRDEACAFIRWALAGEGAAGAYRARSLMTEGLPIRRSVVPVVEAEGPVDPAWHTLLTTIYPHSRLGAEWPDALAAAADTLLDLPG
jgi:multiple sugar transport system substrate-binding protein